VAKLSAQNGRTFWQRTVALQREQHNHWLSDNSPLEWIDAHRLRTVFVNSSGKLRTHLAQNHHQRIQKTGEIGLTEILTLAFRLTLPSQIVPKRGENGPSIPP